jgi:hypothetical protein
MPRSRNVLKQFGDSCAQLAQQLKNETFSAEDRMFVENHLLIVQLALTMSKYSHARAQASADE